MALRQFKCPFWRFLRFVAIFVAIFAVFVAIFIGFWGVFRFQSRRPVTFSGRSLPCFEEETLREFYPGEYPAYAARTFVLIPFIPATGGDDDDRHAD